MSRLPGSLTRPACDSTAGRNPARQQQAALKAIRKIQEAL
jgi:hypothetical protein